MNAAAAVPDLTRLADRDERIITAGTADDIVWDDERLQDELHDAAHRLSIR